MKEFANEKPFEYHTNNGFVFKCERSDFSRPITVHGIPVNLEHGPTGEMNLRAVMSAVAEMISYHRGEVHPNLNGFAGYDCLNWNDSGELGMEENESVVPEPNCDGFDFMVMAGDDRCWPKIIGKFTVVFREGGKKAVKIIGIDAEKIMFRQVGEEFVREARYSGEQRIRVWAFEDGAVAEASKV